VPARSQPSIDDTTAGHLARLGHTIAAVLGGAQDIEWAIADGTLWILQARPVTTAPPPRAGSPASTVTLSGTPGSHGTATGPARIVLGPADFSRVCPGDILVCPFTDPAWTPMLRVAAGVVTEIGGVLSHAAIVARERHIPAVLGAPHATTTLRDGTRVTINGSTGTVTMHA
jgi:pyruvate,water dikinase